MKSRIEHVDSVLTYTIIWIVLIGATVLTTAVASVDLGVFSPVVALTIAAAKSILVALFFMHVRHSSRLTRLVVMGGLLWLLILISLSMADFATRGWIGVPGK